MDETRNHDLRPRVARQIMDSRRLERFFMNKVWDRSGEEYLKVFSGLKHLLDYARTFENPTVLDIGAGTTRGIAEIAQSEEGEGIQFLATVLKKDEETRKHLGNRQTIMTPAETLKGVSDNSTVLILALNSILYSEAPEMVVQSIDRVLKTGGVLKATYQTDEGKSIGPLKLHAFKEFRPFFKKRGYEIASISKSGTDVVLLVKPGGKRSVTELLQADLKES